MTTETEQDLREQLNKALEASSIAEYGRLEALAALKYFYGYALDGGRLMLSAYEDFEINGAIYHLTAEADLVKGSADPGFNPQGKTESEWSRVTGAIGVLDPAWVDAIKTEHEDEA